MNRSRLLVEGRDGEDHRRFTVGVSLNSADASFPALSDSIVFKLLRER